jgi:hypothetical protein
MCLSPLPPPFLSTLHCSSADAWPKLTYVKDCLKSFAFMKAKYSTKHQFGLVRLRDKAEWLAEPTSNLDDFKKGINMLVGDQEYKSFSMDSLFELVYVRFCNPFMCLSVYLSICLYLICHGLIHLFSCPSCILVSSM